MKVRFQANADLNEDIVSGVLRREPSIDFRTAGEADLSGLPDPNVLAVAAHTGRALVSHDLRTLPHHFAEFVRNETSYGLFIISQKTSTLEAIEELILIWNASEAEEWLNTICVIPL